MKTINVQKNKDVIIDGYYIPDVQLVEIPVNVNTLNINLDNVDLETKKIISNSELLNLGTKLVIAALCGFFITMVFLLDLYMLNNEKTGEVIARIAASFIIIYILLIAWLVCYIRNKYLTLGTSNVYRLWMGNGMIHIIMKYKGYIKFTSGETVFNEIYYSSPS